MGVSKAELQAELDRARAQAAKLNAYVAALEEAVRLAPEGLTSRDQSARVGHRMEAETVTRHPGPRIKSEGPVALAAKNSGESIRAIAGKLGIGWSALKMADKRRKANEATRQALSKPPYSVPLDSWK